MLWVGLVLFVVIDAIVVAVVMRRVRSKPGGVGAVSLPDLGRFTSAAAEETRRYMSANYGGDTTSLPTVLQGLVDRLAECAREQGLSLDRATLKQLAALSAISLKAASSHDVRTAIESVA